MTYYLLRCVVHQKLDMLRFMSVKLVTVGVHFFTMAAIMMRA